MNEGFDPFAMPAWAAVLFANKADPPKRPDLPTTDARPPPPAPSPAVNLAVMKKKRGRPFGTTKAAIAARKAVVAV